MDDLILLVEDDKVFGQTMKDFLEMNGFAVDWAKDGISAITLFRESNPRLILLDVQLPGKDGFEVATEIRKSNSFVPIIFITGTAMDEASHNKAYCSLRATNYIEKPVIPQKILAQIKGLLQPGHIFRYEINGHRIAIDGQLVIINHREFQHSAKEIEIFSFLLDNIDVQVARKDILLKVWGNDDYKMNSVLDSAMKNIRKSLKEFPSIKIKTYYGGGHKLFFEENR